MQILVGQPGSGVPLPAWLFNGSDRGSDLCSGADGGVISSVAPPFGDGEPEEPVFGPERRSPFGSSPYPPGFKPAEVVPDPFGTRVFAAAVAASGAGYSSDSGRC